ncbi:MAG: DMT family transporter [Candidatus Sericytochromatia bacterium]
MSLVNVLKLILLSIIWSLGYVFMKNVVPSLGPIWTADLRFLIGGLVLLTYLKINKSNFNFSENWKKYLIIGFLNLALPIALVSLSLIYIPLSYATIINSLTPLFSVLSGFFLLKERITPNQVIGIFLGFLGVFFISSKSIHADNSMFLVGIICCIIASASFALAGTYIKQKAKDINSYAMAACSQLFASLVLLPLGVVKLPTKIFETSILLNLSALGIIGSALGYIIYYNLIMEIGPSKALTIMFLIPFFGMIWGKLFFGEIITLKIILGCFLVLSGTFFVVKKKA